MKHTLLATVSLLALTQMAIADDQTVTVYAWGGYISPATVEAFKAATGKTVNIVEFAGVEDPETRLLTGDSGFDLVVTAGFTVPRLIGAGAIAPLDKAALPNIGNIDPEFVASKLSLLDPGLEYTVPVNMGFTTIAINADKVKEVLGDDVPLDSLDLIFNPETLAKLSACGVSYLDSGLEVIGLALLATDVGYQFKPTDEELARAEALLKAAVPHVRYFDNLRYVQDLASGDLCVALAWNNDVVRASKMAAEAGKPQNLQILYPKEGALLWSDHYVIPVDAPNPEGGAAFLNFLMEGQWAAEITNNFAMAAPNTKSVEFVTPDYRDNPMIWPPTDWLATLKVNDTFSQETVSKVMRAYTVAKTGG